MEITKINLAQSFFPQEKISLNRCYVWVPEWKVCKTTPRIFSAEKTAELKSLLGGGGGGSLFSPLVIRGGKILLSPKFILNT